MSGCPAVIRTRVLIAACSHSEERAEIRERVCAQPTRRLCVDCHRQFCYIHAKRARQFESTDSASDAFADFQRAVHDANQSIRNAADAYASVTGRRPAVHFAAADLREMTCLECDRGRLAAWQQRMGVGPFRRRRSITTAA